MRSDSETSRENEPSPVVDSTAPLEPKFIEEIFNVSSVVRLDQFHFGNRTRFVLQTVDKRRENLLDTNRDLMLHFNPRFKHGYIAINAFKNNVWQREKRIPSPFEYEKVYTVDFVFKENSAIMYVNGQFLYEYVQRLPGLFKKASSVGCYGDLDIHSVHIA
ncbi:hypothetical protein Y032_0233g3099 [Ancylostoma ceylanicum]|uniref:Galectin n=1 Tax=Ancylostoma ceylanicum TaxID=53326 RepID=A0A016SG38_9BILA|nr:hypothetical protein Y032_0233g3099 [Ancylostoma ceylanicum]